MNTFSEMLDMPRPVSLTHRPMSRYKRAAQFAPFAALTGYEELISESGRYVEAAPQLCEDKKSELDRRLHILLDNKDREAEITVTYFIKDYVKDGGSIEKITGTVKTVDIRKKKLFFTDSSFVGLEDIIDIEGSIFEY